MGQAHPVSRQRAFAVDFAIMTNYIRKSTHQGHICAY
jgi:hypothetical protein